MEFPRTVLQSGTLPTPPWGGIALLALSFGQDIKSMRHCISQESLGWLLALYMWFEAQILL